MVRNRYDCVTGGALTSNSFCSAGVKSPTLSLTQENPPSDLGVMRGLRTSSRSLGMPRTEESATCGTRICQASHTLGLKCRTEHIRREVSAFVRR